MSSQSIELLVDSPDKTITRDSQKSNQTGVGSSVEAETPSLRNQVQYVPSGNGAAYWGPGSLMTFLLTGKETRGAFFLAEISVPAGGGPPPHIHEREDESFYLLEGTLTIRVGETTIAALSGDSVFLPRGIVHTFKNSGSGNARALVVITPAGLESYFAEVFELATDRTLPPPPPGKELIARAMAASQKYGLKLFPPV